MTQTNSNSRVEGHQFRLVKFFAYASFIVLIIFSFPFSVVISQQAKDILMKSYENYAILLGENLNHQVFQNYILPLAVRNERISLREQKQQDWMDQIVKRSIYSFNIDLVNIYQPDQAVIAYSTKPELIGKKVEESLGYKKAVKGEHSSGLIFEGEYILGSEIEGIGGQKKLRTYIPLRIPGFFTEGKMEVGGIFELIQDLTQEYKSIVKLQYLIFGLSILIMGLIFVALLLIVHKAEGIIEKRASEQSNLEAQLHQAERLATLGQMIAGVSHEIRNPLGIIRSTAELLGGKHNSNPVQEKLSGVIIEEASRLNDIVTEFLDFARPKTPNFQDSQLGDILLKNLQFLQPEFNKEHIQVEENLKGKTLPLRADPHLLYRAFLNIFINAIHSMQGGGNLTVDVSRQRHQYIVNISDTGCGIAKESLEKIFDPFFSNKDKGSGLGLSIVRNIIEGHQGTIRIKSEEGKGTKVAIRLNIE